MQSRKTMGSKSRDFPGYSLSWYVKTLPSSVATGIAAVEICFWLLKRKIPDALASIHHYCLSLKDMALNHLIYHINNSNQVTCA